MTPEQMMAAGWKVFDFTAGNFEAWRDQALEWVAQNWDDYPLESYAFSCDGQQGTMNIACYWAVSPATLDVLQAHVTGVPQPPVVSIGEVTSQATATEGTGTNEEDKPSGVNPIGVLDSPIDFGKWRLKLPKWLMWLIAFMVVRMFMKKQRKPPKSQPLKSLLYKLTAW